MVQDADTEGLVTTCRLLCSSGSRCLVAVEKRTSEVYERFVDQARAAFGEVRVDTAHDITMPCVGTAVAFIGPTVCLLVGYKCAIPKPPWLCQSDTADCDALSTRGIVADVTIVTKLIQSHESHALAKGTKTLQRGCRCKNSAETVIHRGGPTTELPSRRDCDPEVQYVVE